MRILIIGGLGVLGQELAGLMQSEEVHILDTADPSWKEKFEELGGRKNYGDVLYASKWDVIFYLAEEARLRYSGANQVMNACVAHIVELESVLSVAAVQGTQVVVPVWSEIAEVDPVGATINFKRKIISSLSRGNARVSVVELPIILEGSYPASNRGAIVTRFMETTEGNSLHLWSEDFKQEFDPEIGKDKRTQYLELPRLWCSLETAAKSVWEVVGKSRASAHAPGIRASLLEIVHALMVSLSRTTQVIEFQDFEPVCVTRHPSDQGERYELREILAENEKN